MATYADTKILQALAARLQALVLSPVLPVMFPGENFAPTSGGAYLAASFLPAQTFSPGIQFASTNDHRGIFQVSVFWPEGLGVRDPMERAGAIVSHFKRGTYLYREGVTVKVLVPPYVSAPLQEPGWIQIPVSIPYRAFILNP